MFYTKEEFKDALSCILADVRKYHLFHVHSEEPFSPEFLAGSFLSFRKTYSPASHCHFPFLCLNLNEIS